MNVPRTLAKASVFLALVLLVASVSTSTGAFTTASLNRPSSVQLGGGEALVGLDAADSVSVACSEPLVTVTNNFDDRTRFEVTISEDRDGEVSLSESESGSESVRFTLSPGDSETVYVTNVRGPVWDDVEFTVTATSSNTEVTVSERVPKVPGNEAHEDGDGNWGGDECGGGDGDDEDNDADEGGDDAENDGHGSPPRAGGA